MIQVRITSDLKQQKVINNYAQLVGVVSKFFVADSSKVFLKTNLDTGEVHENGSTGEPLQNASLTDKSHCNKNLG